MKNTKYHRVELSHEGKRITWSGVLFTGEGEEGKLNLALVRAGGGLDFSCQASGVVSSHATVETGNAAFCGVAYDIGYHQQSQDFAIEWIPAFLVQVDVPFGTVDQEGMAVQAAYVLAGTDGREVLTLVASGREVLRDKRIPTSKPVDPRPLAKVIQFPGNRVVH